MLIFLSQSYIAVDNSVFVNELLTYRPTIWNYYFNEALAAPWFGNGPVMEDTSTGAAIAYQAAVERGVGELYGPHSMYLRYFYESGGIG
ncbi:O-antigen ligase family protein, partial [Staphylococcus aureus]|uniref:O-antigen ligase family protein n=1 Tax=Staphylococcus aureus TaxID=1280 RepID=UPI00301CD913